MADNYTFKDSGGLVVTHASEEISAGVHVSKHILVDSTGAALVGQKTMAASLPVVIASDDDLQGKLGVLTETAPATDTASAGLNGRLQRVAQRITSLIALLPASLGQKAMSDSLPVVLASDQSDLPTGGNVAHDAADSGNPIKIGGKARTSLPLAVSADDRVNAYFDAHGRLVVSRGMHGGEIYSLAARTASPSVPLQRNVSAQGVYIIVEVSAAADTPTVTPQFVITSPLDDSSFAAPYKVLWQPTTPITAAGTYVFLLHPGIVNWTRVGYVGIDDMAAIPIPSHWALAMNHADADSITYQVLYSYIP